MGLRSRDSTAVPRFLLLAFVIVSARKEGGRLKEGSELFTGPPWKTLKLAIFIFKNFWLQIWFQKYYISPYESQFLINKHKNRGRFLFTRAPVKSSLPRFKALRKEEACFKPRLHGVEVNPKKAESAYEIPNLSKIVIKYNLEDYFGIDVQMKAIDLEIFILYTVRSTKATTNILLYNLKLKIQKFLLNLITKKIFTFWG
jgi:hypothetical protein